MNIPLPLLEYFDIRYRPLIGESGAVILLMVKMMCVTWRSALSSLRHLGVMFSTECVHQLVNQVEHRHLERNPALLLRLHTDEQTVETVGLAINTVSTQDNCYHHHVSNLSPRSLLTRSTNTILCRVTSP